MTDELFPISNTLQVAKLSGPSSQILKLEGSGRQEIQWSTTDRQAMELEIRARLVSTTAGVPPLIAGSQPLINWLMEIGHGKAVWSRPCVAVAVGGSSLMRQLWTMPTRGLYLRVSARQLKLAFVCTGDFTVPQVAVRQSKIEVSFQPVSASFAPTYPRSQLCRFPGGTFGACEFPMEANEFRVRDANGIPFAVAATSVLYIGFNGGAVGAADAAACAEWTPIPTRACKYGSSAVEAEFEFR